MSKPVVTYMKREYKKVLPVLILSLCYAAFVFILVYLRLNDENTILRQRLAYVDEAGYFYMGDLFLNALWEVLNEYHRFLVIVFEVLLIRKVFYQENRAGVSDFLRILPIKERNKIMMKICAGESVILGFCAVFGILGTIVYNVLSPGLEERAGIFPIESLTMDESAIHTCRMIWQTSFLMFLALSAMFLVLFLMQCCVHNMPVALFAGFGLLYAPYYYTSLNEMAVWGDKEIHMSNVAASFLSHYPYVNGGGVLAGSEDLMCYYAKLMYYGEKIWFLIAVILIAAVMLAIALRLRWNVKGSNNIMINSPAVAEFIVTGLSISVGVGVAVLTGNEPYTALRATPMEKYAFYFVTLAVGAVVWVLFHVINMAVMKRQRGV